MGGCLFVRAAMNDAAYKRFGIAIALAIVLHVVFAAYIKLPIVHAATHSQSQPVTVFRVKREPRPVAVRIAPAKVPPARRKPRIVVNARSRTAAGARARQVRHTHTAARSAPKLAVRHELVRPQSKPALPTAHVAAPGTRAHGATQTGGSAQINGSGAGGEGGRANAGTGTGAAGSGNGDGVAPCGTIYIVRRGPIKTSDGFEHVHVGIQMQLRNGSLSPEVALPYPLLYRSDDESPFSARNRNNPNFPTLLQFPPDDMDQSAFPELIKIVLAHTTSGGYTDFGSCPSDMKSDGPP